MTLTSIPMSISLQNPLRYSRGGAPQRLEAINSIQPFLDSHRQVLTDTYKLAPLEEYYAPAAGRIPSSSAKSAETCQPLGK